MRSNSFLRLVAFSMQMQLSLALGFAFCLASSYFFLWINDPRYPVEQPMVVGTGLALSVLAFIIGWYMVPRDKYVPLSIKDGAIIAILTWIIATAISTTVFVLAGFPIPAHASDFPLLRRIADGIFESISGFTTAGGSILPSVEVFSRSVLLWRSTTHLLGGMGMAYMAVTLLSRFVGQRGPILTGEAEGPNEIRFDKEEDARTSGFDFLKIYLLLTALMISALVVSGVYGRATPYLHWYDNVFDATNYAFSSMGTGGFGVYDASAGLPITTDHGTMIGGLQNPTSEWIITLFMFLAGGNLSLWFILCFRPTHFRSVLRNKELHAYLGFIAVIAIGIWSILMSYHYYNSGIETLRYTLFNIATIISTTGLANTNFHLWPAGAIGLLFLVYFTGGMVGSTAGGLKFLRFVILYQFMKAQLQNFLFGRHITRFTIDGVHYDMKAASLVVINIVLYFTLFLLGAIGIMIVSPIGTMVDGSTKVVDLVSAIGASIANLGNIGPTAALGSIDAGPTGNYFAYTPSAKIIMSFLMLVGRIGVFTFIIPFISAAGLREVSSSITVQRFDPDEPQLRA